MAIRNAKDAIAATIRARQPRPTIDEVLDRIEMFAQQGYAGVCYSTPLPEQTVKALTEIGFEVEPGNQQVYWDAKEDSDGNYQQHFGEFVDQHMGDRGNHGPPDSGGAGQDGSVRRGDHAQGGHPRFAGKKKPRSA